MDRVYTIRTPEMVRFDFRLAGPASRFFAWAIDLAALFLILAASVLATCLGSAMIGAAGASGAFGTAALIAVAFTVYYGYFGFCEWRSSGRTIGKRLMGLRVLQDNGTQIAPFQAIARNLVRIVDSLVPFYAVGLGSLLGTRRLQRLGDLVAGTIVVREDREAGRPSAAPLLEARPAAAQAAAASAASVASGPTADAGLAPRMARRLSNDERELLVDAARRADEIDLAVRGPLFARLAGHFAARLEVERDAHVSDEKLVLNLARALLAHEREGAAGGL